MHAPPASICPFSNFKPAFLRKIVTNDFALRQGTWQPLVLDANSSATLKGAVASLMTDLERTLPEKYVEIDMNRPANTSSAPDIAVAAYKVGETTPFEQGLRHLMGVADLPAQTTAAETSTQESSIAQQPTTDENCTAG